MLDKILESCQFVVNNTKYVKINYNQTNDICWNLYKRR